MVVKTIRRIAFGGVALFLLVQAAQSIREMGLTQEAAFPAALGALFAVMAIWGKSG